MKAKDTVTETKDHSESICCPHCGEEFGIESEISYARETQSEISFKAGMKEVVDWIELHSLLEFPSDSEIRLMSTVGVVLMSKDGWEAQLKEWFKGGV